MNAERRTSMALPLATRVMNLGQKPKPVIEIVLDDDQQDSFVPSYTSLDEIKGEAHISTSADMIFQDIYITFEGISKTFVEKVATTAHTNGRTEAFRNFLRLVQPMDSESLPVPRVLEAGKIHKFPFTFVVPERLLPQSCNHLKDGTFPEGGHLALPPSLGDPMVASMGKSLMDDMSPDMGMISYCVKCRVTHGRGPTGKIRILTEDSRKLRIIPAFQEEPPLNDQGGPNDEYKLRKEKSIKKGLFKSKLGRLVMESAQPTSLRLPPLRSSSDCAVTTMATVYVRFDPADENSQPPRLNNLQAKLKIATFFASVPIRELPVRTRDFHYSSVRGIFVEGVNLASRSLSNQSWEKHTSTSSTPPTPPRRDSAWSTVSSSYYIPSSSSAYHGKTFYTARIIVPISLPKGNKVFVPTFHSCLISRIYALDLNLSLQTPSASVSDPSLHLKLPVQISSEGNPNAQPLISASEANAIALREADTFFDPRSVAPPSPGFTERGQLHAPPSPGPGWTHRESGRSMPEPSTRMRGAQQRFQSLSFEDEEGTEAAAASPPDYTATGIGDRSSSNVPRQPGD